MACRRMLSIMCFCDAERRGFLHRYIVSAGTVTQVDSGLIIEADTPALWPSTIMAVSGRLTNLPAADVPNRGRLRVYLDTDFASPPKRPP
jgi:hypothetical protein